MNVRKTLNELENNTFGIFGKAGRKQYEVKHMDHYITILDFVFRNAFIHPSSKAIFPIVVP